MRRILSNVLLVVISVHSSCTTASDTQSRVPAPIVVLEATETVHGIGGYQDGQMLVRLTNDGKVEWDKWVGKAWERQISSVTAERVSGIKRRLDAIDKSGVRAEMGPYYSYVDTSVELRIRITTSQGELSFSVMNPWSCDLPTCLSRKPLPTDVKTVVCEISALQAQVADTSVDQMCKAENASQ